MILYSNRGTGLWLEKGTWPLKNEQVFFFLKMGRKMSKLPPMRMGLESPAGLLRNQ